MKRLALTTALSLSLGTAYAAPAQWQAYNYSTRSCEPLGVSPEAFINILAMRYRVSPEVHNNTNDSGKVLSAYITIPTDQPGKGISWAIFRDLSDCWIYAFQWDYLHPDKYQ